MNVFRFVRYSLVAAAVALPLVACGTQTAGTADSESAMLTPDSASVTPTTELAGDPSLEPTGPEVPRPPGGGVSVSLPSLPVGGQSEPERAAHQCVPVNWLEPPEEPYLPDGVSVSVTAVQITPPGLFEQDKGRSGCGGTARCDTSFAFTSQRMACSVRVTAKGNGGQTARLSVVGKVNCSAGQGQKCRDIAASVTPQSIEVIQPGEQSLPGEQPSSTSSSEQNPPTSTG